MNNFELIKAVNSPRELNTYEIISMKEHSNNFNEKFSPLNHSKLKDKKKLSE